MEKPSAGQYGGGSLRPVTEDDNGTATDMTGKNIE